MSNQDDPRAVRRTDYRPPAFLIDTVDLHFDLDPTATTVRSRLAVRRNPAYGDPSAPLRLDGEALTLLSVRLDGEPLSANRATEDAGGLVISDLPDACTLEIENRI